MDRRAFLLFTAAGVVSPDSSIVAFTQGPVAPPAPIDPPMFSGSGDAAFDAWREDFVRRQVAAGWSADFLRQQLAGLVPDAKVVSLDGAQPEFSKPIGDYIRGAVSDARISMGRNRRDGAPWLADIQARYGVPSEILVAIWAMETGFGANMGDMDVIRSLASLAAEGRRRDWAEGQLLAALRMIQGGEASRAQLRGSWAGAMGQTQFMPDTFLTTAVDADRDGRRDIWGSSQDALASAANLLAKASWNPGQDWARGIVLPPEFDYSLAEGPRQPPAAWEGLGARRADGRRWPAADEIADAALIVPAGAAGPAFLVFPNHFVIRKYNNSTAYALAVGMIADGIVGAGALVAAWPYEQPLSRADRIGAQQALAQLGFNPGDADGVIGVNTRASVRAYQQARRMVADGYLSSVLAKQLIAEAAAPAAPWAGAPPPATTGN